MILFLLIAECSFAQCNGHNSLCSKRYDEVAYLTTHNAYNTEEDGHTLPNNTMSITNQLLDGVRGLMIDIYEDSGVNVVYHGFEFLGERDLSEVLGEVKTFMDGNPNEVVTLILESYITASSFETDIVASGLDTFLYTHDGQWPTLQEMIDSNERLVILSDVDDASPGQEWYHYVWDLAVETHYAVHDTSQFNCEFNRGDSINDLFILNHFVTDAQWGVGWDTIAVVANANPFFINRAVECMTSKGKFPNFPTVDFHHLGNALQTVDILNGITQLSTENSQTEVIQIAPNPVRDVLKITGSTGQIQVFNSFGEKLELPSRKPWLHITELNFRNLPPGVYHLIVDSERHKIIHFNE